MTQISYSLASLIAAAIILIGVRFLWSPTQAARDYGVPTPPTQTAGFAPFPAIKGLRDIVSGLFLLLLILNGPPRLLGEFLLVASLIALGDAAIVLRAGGPKKAAFGIHGATALLILATGATLLATPHP